jgi:hypothetical protein
MTLSMDISDDDIAGVPAPEGGYAIWIRPKVWNYPKKEVARNVQVLIQELVTPAGRRASADFTPMGALLNWSDTNSDAANIPPGIWRRIDGFECRVGMANLPSVVWWISLHKLHAKYPVARRYWIEEGGTYNLRLAVTADNCDPSYWDLQFTFRPDPAASSTVDVAQQFTNVLLVRGKPSTDTPW